MKSGRRAVMRVRQMPRRGAEEIPLRSISVCSMGGVAQSAGKMQPVAIEPVIATDAAESDDADHVQRPVRDANP